MIDLLEDLHDKQQWNEFGKALRERLLVDDKLFRLIFKTEDMTEMRARIGMAIDIDYPVTPPHGRL